MYTTAARPLLDERERLAVLVTELLRFATGPDASVRTAGRTILRTLLDSSRLADEDRRLAAKVLALPEAASSTS